MEVYKFWISVQTSQNLNAVSIYYRNFENVQKNILSEYLDAIIYD